MSSSQAGRARPRSTPRRSSPSRTTRAPTTRRTPKASSGSTRCGCARSDSGATRSSAADAVRKGGTMRKLPLGALTFAAIALGACSAMEGKGPAPEPNIFPSDWQNEIINTLTGNLDDPNGIRQASVTEPALKQAGTEQRYVVCTRFDARDINGQYP